MKEKKGGSAEREKKAEPDKPNIQILAISRAKAVHVGTEGDGKAMGGGDACVGVVRQRLWNLLTRMECLLSNPWLTPYAGLKAWVLRRAIPALWADMYCKWHDRAYAHGCPGVDLHLQHPCLQTYRIRFNLL